MTGRNARVAGVIRHSSVDGPGVRYTVFFQGCFRFCDGCHNPDLWDLNGGEEVPIDILIENFECTEYLDGVTMSGGEPLLQPEAVIALADAAHKKGMTAWCYTGWTLEEILDGMADEEAVEALHHIDVLIDGPFKMELTDGNHIYRGSSNQRLIDVPASLNAGKAVCLMEVHKE